MIHCFLHKFWSEKMGAPATSAGAGDVARKGDDTPESRPIRECCKCGHMRPVYAWWEHGNAAVCSAICNALKEEEERISPHYWQEKDKPPESLPRPKLRAVA